MSDSPSSKSWRSRIRRSRSSSAMTPPSPHSSPPDSIPPPSVLARYYANPNSPSPVGEGVDLAPVVSSSEEQQNQQHGNKAWEHHYKSFLRRRLLGLHKLSSQSFGSDHVDSDGSKHHTPKRRVRGSSTGSSSSPQKQQQQTDTVPSSPRPSTPTAVSPGGSILKKKMDRSISDGDTAVRGGSLFQSVFRRDNNSSNKSPSGHRRNKSSFDSLSDRNSFSKSPTSNHRRNKSSSDSLDKAVRKGQDVAFSPQNSRFKVIQPEDAQHISPMPDLEGSIRGGVPLHQQQHTTNANTTTPTVPAALQKLAKTTKSKEMKVAFTEFHNSSKFAEDTTSAYLGDEPSTHQSDLLTFAAAASDDQSRVSRNHGSLSERGVSIRTARKKYGSADLVAFAPVTEDRVTSSMRVARILNPLRRPDAWISGRRYLIAPAVLRACPIQVLTVLSGGTNNNNNTTEQENPAFGTVVLGKATVSYVGLLRSSSQKTENYGWSSCMLVLRQNYLLEYDNESSTNGLPRGFAHLQYATCYPHSNFHDSLHLEFYGSPCAKGDKRTLMIRVGSQKERDRWVSCLSTAARLGMRDLYDFDDTIEFGRGRYAAVYPARRKTSGSSEPQQQQQRYDCAIKIVDKNEFWHRVQMGRERADTLVRETAVQATLSAKCGRLPTFLQIRGFFETCDNVIMEMELSEGPDLFQYISTNGTLNENEAAHIMRDVLTSLDAMRRIGVAHRDVKPANILMCDNREQGVAVKLGDFGMSTLTCDDKSEQGVAVKLGDFGMSTFVGVDSLVRGRCGTPGYVAPEIFNAGVRGGYGNKVDVFSAGVTLYVMLCGYEPFYGESDTELIAANKEADVQFSYSDWCNVSQEGRDLVKKMLAPDPNERIDAGEALLHPWITNRAPVASWSEMRDRIDRMTLTSKDISGDAACTIS